MKMSIHPGDEWEAAQLGELEWHKQNPWRGDDELFRSGTANLMTKLGYIPASWKGKTILDMGCGPRLRTRYFDDARILALDPLALDYMTSFPWCDLTKAAEIYPQAAEENLPWLSGKVDFIFCLNSINHGYNLDAVLANIHDYLKDDGECYIGYDVQAQVQTLHPLVITSDVMRTMLKRNQLVITRYESLESRHPAYISWDNYWLRKGNG